MAKDAKKRQKKLQKQAAKRKQKRALVNQRSTKLATPALSRAKSWPVENIWISAHWPEPELLTQIIFTRRGPNGHLALGNVLIDKACLGVKNAYGRIVGDYEYQETLTTMKAQQPMIQIDDINLVAKLIRDSVAYARECGLRPNKDLRLAMSVLGDADPDASDVEIRLGGHDGKPHFITGPYDDINRIVNTLTRHLGADGFNVTVMYDEEYGDGMSIEEYLTGDNIKNYSGDTIEFEDEGAENTAADDVIDVEFQRVN
ncbi:MAG: hypothetical protein AAF639_06345 [Chloroflexota bacterium]